MQFSTVQTSVMQPIFSPCFNYFVTNSNNNIYIKDAACLDLKNHAQINIKQKNSKAYNIKFTIDSKLFAVKVQKRLEIYDIHGNLRVRIRDQSHQIEQFAWSQHSFPYQIMVFCANLTYCTIYNIHNTKEDFIKNFKFKTPNGYSFSKGSHPGVFMALLQRHNGKDCIGIYYTGTWELVNFIQLDTFDAVKIQFTKNGSIVVFENKINFKVYMVDPFRGVTNAYGEKDYCLGVATYKFSNNGDFLALGAHDDCIHLLNTATWKLISELELSEKIDLTKTIIHKQQKQTFITITQGKYKLPFKSNYQNTNGQVAGISLIQFSPNDDYIAAKIDTLPSAVFIYEVKTLNLISVIQLLKSVKDFKWIPNSSEQSTLCICCGLQSLLFWRDNCVQNAVFQISVPKPNDIKITNIDMAGNGSVILYSSGLRKYCYAKID